MGEKLAQAGIMTLIFDFRGCGESDGKFEDETIAMGYEDAVAGYTFLRNHELCDRTN
jgi:alpha/beta superfamily hydrolase